MDTKVVDVPERGRFEVRVDDRVVGLASYHVEERHDDPAAHRGRPRASAAAASGRRWSPGVLDAARERGLHVLPYCSFIRHYIQQHPEHDRPRRRRRPAALRPGDRRPLTCAIPAAPPTLRRCRRRCCGSAATCGSPTIRLCWPPVDDAGARRRRRPGLRARPAALGAGRRTPPAVPARLPAGAPDYDSDGALVLRSGDPATVDPARWSPRSARAACTSRADAGPYGRRRDDAVERALGDVPLVRTGSPYAVTPGRVTKADGTPFRVFSPFARAWRAHGWRAPAPRPTAVPVGDRRPVRRPAAGARTSTARLPAAGEAAARAAWRRFRDERLPGYGEGRNLPGTDGTSRLSAYLKYGCIHPRTLLADLAERSAATARRSAGTPTSWPGGSSTPTSSGTGRRPRKRGLRRADGAAMTYDRGADADERFAAWAEGRTGYPIVDAGMRQLRGEAWVHNRVRMIVASFLVKDLHLDWWRGARLLPAAPGRRRPGQQQPRLAVGRRHRHRRLAVLPGVQPDHPGQAVRPGRRLRPPLGAGAARRPGPVRARAVAGARAASPTGYPEPIVEHAHERQVALDRYQEVRSGA